MSFYHGKKAEVTTGDVSVNLPPATQANQVEDMIYETGPGVIPAGKLKVMITNVGFNSANGGGNPANATINGKPMAVSDIPKVYEAVHDPVTNEFKKTPTIIYNGNGSMLEIITVE